jgi:protein tyrosine phosphatase (PTP) superfamily phosphohydrolase (DUF442 family)
MVCSWREQRARLKTAVQSGWRINLAKDAYVRRRDRNGAAQSGFRIVTGFRPCTNVLALSAVSGFSDAHMQSHTPKLFERTARIIRAVGKISAVAAWMHLASPCSLLCATDAEPQPIQLHGIENAFRVTERILAGSQPKDDEAFTALREAGVNTIISVDGEKPDAAAARRRGLHYVHLPFGYDAIPASRVAELVKAAAPGAGNIFVHCHHGKHRGPTAVAVICEAVAGWSPARAEAWLRLAGTAEDYPGLYRAVREFRAPTASQLAAVGLLPEIAKTPPLVDTMVAMDDVLERLKAELSADPHSKEKTTRRLPTHTTVLLLEQLRELARTGDMATRPEEFRRLLAGSEKSVATLLDLARHYQPSTPDDLAPALKHVTESCTACHKAFRNGSR